MKLFANATKKRRIEAPEVKDELQRIRKGLPVYKFKKELIRAINRHEKVVIIVAETGSGKSTQIPAYLLNSAHRIAVTQPRRVAAISLAQRVSLENGSVVGRHVGYRVRFEDCSSRTETQLLYVTDGMLLREAMSDPWLRKYSLIFLDESHERSLQTDILLGVVQRARKVRFRSQNPLHLVVMSATLQVNSFRDFFGGENTTLIKIPGRQFPVQILYASEPVQDYLEAALSTIVQIHNHEDPGDILVFLSGQEEIEDLAGMLKQFLQEEDAEEVWTGDRVESLQEPIANASRNAQVVNGVMICLLYASLPPEAQMAAFQDKPVGCTRKVIIATNIAETSVTLPDIKYVVDTGKHKCRRIRATGMEVLQVEDISKAQASQRAGRSGRVQEGVCFRLYTEDAFQELEESAMPEILRVSLSQVVLQLKGMGVKDPREFDFVTAPDVKSLSRAMKLLFALDALDTDMEMTSYGKKLARLPLDPVFGHLLLKSTQYECTKEMLTAVAVLSTDNLFYRQSSRDGGEGGNKSAAAHRRFFSHEGDLPSCLNVYWAWQSEAIFVPSSSGGYKAEKKLMQQQRGKNKLHHAEWCRQNFISGRALVRAFDIRGQLERMCERPPDQGGIGMDTTLSCGNDRKRFLKCAAAGLFLQAASRVKVEGPSSNSAGRSGTVLSTRGRYQTMVGKEFVSIHPISTMFGRQPAPACVVYSELVTTKRTYIRGVTQIREEWLTEVAPDFYS